MEEKNKRSIFFILGFFAIIGAYYLFINLIGEDFFDGYISMTSSLTAGLLSIFEEGIYSNGPRIGTNEFSVMLSFGCEGTEPLIIYLAAIISFPAALKSKIKGIVTGSLILYAMNVIRVGLLYFIGRSNPGSFELFHTTIFPVLFIFFAIVSWGIWAQSLKKAKT